MCDLLTFAVPENRADVVPEGVGKESEAPTFLVEPYVSRGSGHSFSDGLSVFSLVRGGCSCGVLSKDFKTALLDFLARTAAQCESVEVVIHRHSGEFEREPFVIKATTTLSATDLVGKRVRLARDIRYVISDENVPLTNSGLERTSATRRHRRAGR